MVVVKTNTSSSSSISSSNYYSTDDKSQCLVIREINSCEDNFMVGIDNDLDEPEITSPPSIENLSHTIILFEQVSNSEDTLVKWDEKEQIMAD